MRPRSLLVLLAVVLALAAFIWFYERELPGSEERAAQARRLIPGLEADEVTAFEIAHGEERVRVERVEAGEPGGDGETAEAGTEAEEAAAAAPTEWRIAAPERFAGARADRVAADGLVSALAALERSRTLEDFDRRALGLGEPRARLTLERREGEPIAIAVGADVPASTEMVVLREDTGEAHLVDRAILQDLTRPAGDWRSREVVAAARQDVERITLTGGGGGRVVLARGEGGFRIVRPLDDVADPDAVDELLGALAGLSAERFVDAPDASPAELGLAPPRARVSAELAGGRPPVVVEIGAPRAEGRGHTFRVGGQLFVAESPLADLAARPPRAWQSPALTTFELYRVDEVAVDGPEGALRLTRSGTDWQRDGRTIPYTPVSDLLFAIVEARAEEIVPAAEAAPGEPQLTLELVAGAAGGEADESVAERQTITLHAPADGLVPATVSGRPWVLRLPTPAVDAIRAHLAAVRTAEPIADSTDLEEIPEGVEVEREEGF